MKQKCVTECLRAEKLTLSDTHQHFLNVCRDKQWMWAQWKDIWMIFTCSLLITHDQPVLYVHFLNLQAKLLHQKIFVARTLKTNCQSAKKTGGSPNQHEGRPLANILCSGLIWPDRPLHPKDPSPVSTQAVIRRLVSPMSNNHCRHSVPMKHQHLDYDRFRKMWKCWPQRLQWNEWMAEPLPSHSLPHSLSHSTVC